MAVATDEATIQAGKMDRGVLAGVGQDMQDTARSVADPSADLVDLPEEYAWLDGGQSYIVCAFYTPNYLEQITSLKRSLEAQGISHFLKRYERAATWEATTRLKPVFVDHCLEKFPDKDVLYLDADAVVRKPLQFFDGQQADISLLFHPTKVGSTAIEIPAISPNAI